MEPNLLLYATYYHSLGMNVVPTKGSDDDWHSYKEPKDEEEWLQFEINEQSISNVLSHNWKEESGIGLVTGFNQYRALDIDSLFSSNDYWAYNVDAGCQLDSKYPYLHDLYAQKFIKKCLELLELPDDYPWVVKSGSGVGAHVIFISDDIEHFHKTNTGYSPNLKWVDIDANGLYVPNFQRIELSWKFFLVLPPSKTYDGETYKFWNGELPKSKPQKVTADAINNLFTFFCGSNKVIDCTYKKERHFKLVHTIKKICEELSYRSENLVPIDDDPAWLMACSSNDARNTLATKYVLGVGVKTDKLKVRQLLENNEDDKAKLNLASLIACGFLKGKQSDVVRLLDDLPIIEGIELSYIEHLKSLAEQNCTKEPHYLFFDTETTGLPRNYKAPVTDSDNWPRLIQLSWIITDIDGKSILERNVLIRPNGYKIPSDVSKLTGITTEKALNEGFDITEVLMEFLSDFEKVNTIVGHNIDFDLNIVRAEFYRLKIKENLEAKPSVCTMKSSTDFCKLPGYYGYRFPKLQVLYKKLFGEEFNNAHNAASDVAATRRCFFELLKRGIIITKNRVNGQKVGCFGRSFFEVDKK